MATYTSFLNLEKPSTSERLDVLKINSNWDKIDAGVSTLNSKLSHRRVAGTYTEQFQAGVYGYVTTSGTVANLYWPMMFQQDVTTVEITKVTIAIRVAGGGYLVGNDADVTQYITNVSTRFAQGIIQIDLTKSDGFGVVNNTPMIGSAKITYTVS